jgi:hypothetical protein
MRSVCASTGREPTETIDEKERKERRGQWARPQSAHISLKVSVGWADSLEVFAAGSSPESGRVIARLLI